MIQRRRHMRVIDNHKCSCTESCDSDCSCSTQESNESGELKLRIAFATVGMLDVNQHFGLAEGFAVYEVSAIDFTMLEAAGFDEQKEYIPGHSEDKLADKIELIKGCVAMYCTAIGPRAVSRLLEHKIHPVKVDEGTPIKTIIKDLQIRIINDDLPNWLQRMIVKKPKVEERELENIFDMEWQDI